MRHTEREEDEQVRAYELPATDGKRGDPQWPAFAARHGFAIDHPVPWEVEALEPSELRRLALAAVEPWIDREILTGVIAEEDRQRRALDAFVARWPRSP